MCRKAGIAEAKLGYTTGFVESVYAVAQFIAMLFWPHLSNRRGRKPVLISCLLGISLCSTAFGFATAVWQMLLFRALAGFFSASTLTVRVVASEISTPATAGYVFAQVMQANNVAFFFSPLLSGILYDPVKQLSFLPPMPLLRAYPAFLACLFSGALCVLSAYLVFHTLPETKPKETEAGEQAERPTYRKLLSYPGVSVAVILLFFNWVFGSITAVDPVFYATSVPLGGWQLSPAQISWYAAFGGVSAMIANLFLFAPLNKRLGVKGFLLISGPIVPINFCWHIMSSMLLRYGQQVVFYVMVPFFCFLNAAGMACTTVSLMLVVNNAAPSPQYLSLTNSLALSLGVAQRAFTPAATSSVFAYGVDHGTPYLAWYLALGVGVAFNILLRWLPKEGRNDATSTNDNTGEA